MVVRKSLFIAALFFFLILGVMLIVFPSECRKGAEYGLYICGKTVIPSLFTFTVCVLFIIRCGVLRHIGFISKYTFRISGLTGEEFAVFIMSLLGGYPVGARLLSDIVKKGKTDRAKAELMALYCTNAGPAFIIIAIGSGCFGSKNAGIILFASSFLSSVLLSLIFGTKVRQYKQKNTTIKSEYISLSECFTSSVADAAGSVIAICSYVILFSTINSCIECISQKASCLIKLKYLTEVTAAVTLTKNIYLVSFLTGFSCLCVWLQIYSIAKPLRIPPLKFIITRIIHGILNCVNTFVLLKIFKPTVSAISNNLSYTAQDLYSTPSLAAALLLMGILFCVSVFSKKICGNIIKDMV